MSEGMVQIPVGRRRIIKRPRLTRLLDESNARLILLVAPAGYGKTTLTRQWLALGPRRHAWYTATAPSADVSALALGLGRVLETVVPGPAERMRQRLLAVPASEEEPELVAEILADSASAWPDEAWLVVDDYHHIGVSPPADAFFARLVQASGIRLVLTSRTHPTWASARSTTYGEVAVLGGRELALTRTESAAVLGAKCDDSLAALLEATKGWPVVTGLAAVAGGSVVPELPSAEALYDFLAGEVFNTASLETRRLLCRLAFVSTPTLDLARRLADIETADHLLEEAERLGLVERERAELRLHPLLRDFLKACFAEYPAKERGDALALLTEHLQAEHAWDDLFELVKQDPTPARLDALIAAALRELVTEGRLGAWCDFAEHQRIETPSIQLAIAEASLLQGKTDATLLLASGAAVALGDDHPLAGRAWIAAGRSAYFLDHFEQSLPYFARAKKITQTEDDRLEARWGEFNSRRMLKAIDLETALAELEPISGAGIDGAVRYATAHATLAERVGGLEEALEQNLPLLPLLGKVRNPAVATNFHHFLGRLLVGQARYDEAVAQFRDGYDLADSFGFRFVLPHVLVGLAHAELGCRRFGLVTRLLARAEAEARACSDVHNLIECEIVRVRMLLALGTPIEALRSSLGPLERPASPTQRGELAAVKAMAAASAGELDQCEAFLAESEDCRWGTQALVLCACSRLIAELARSRDVSDHARIVIEAVTATGWIDPLVTASRARPEIVPLFLSDPSFAPVIWSALERSRDHNLLGRAPGQSRQALEGPRLSGREDQVFALLCQGLSNKEIGRALFISDVTVKVHLRHIYRKLGVRTRLEAVARGGAAFDADY
jgi:LuxR family transcriptional regulator, maltose regulon positive regulatory protein